MVCFHGRSVVRRPYMSGCSWSCQVPRAPLHTRGMTSRIVISADHVSRCYPTFIAPTGSYASPPPSSRLGATLGHQVFAGCCQPLLGGGPSRRYLCTSFPACLDLYPGGSYGAHTRFFPHDSGLPPVRTGSALHYARTATSVRRPFRGCSHFFLFRPAGLLTTQVAPTATVSTVGQPWFLRPSLSWVVTSPRPGYAHRLHRAIDGIGTCTLSDVQPCRLPPERRASAAPGSRRLQRFVRRRMCGGDSPHPQSPRPAVPTTPPDGWSSGTLLRCMPQTSRRQSRPASGVLLRERDLSLCPFPECEAGLPVLIHVPFKDVRCLVQTSQFLGCCLPVGAVNK
jgi:hypothetical protein